MLTSHLLKKEKSAVYVFMQPLIHIEQYYKITPKLILPTPTKEIPLYGLWVAVSVERPEKEINKTRKENNDCTKQCFY